MERDAVVYYGGAQLATYEIRSFLAECTTVPLGRYETRTSDCCQLDYSQCLVVVDMYFEQ